MPDFTDRLPLRRETVETILARLLADSNAGIDPADPSFADTVPGAIWDDLNRSVCLELDRDYDFASSEVPASALPATTTGIWLDAWALSIGVERLDETPASGFLTFQNDGVADVTLPAGTRASTAQLSDEQPAVEFETTEEVTVLAGGQSTVPVRSVDTGAATNVAANTVTTVTSNLDDTISVFNTDAMSSGSDVETDEHLQDKVVRRLRGGGGSANVAFYEAFFSNRPGIGHVTVQRNWAGPGSVRVILTDVENNPLSAPALAAEQAAVDPFTFATQIDHAAGYTLPVATITVDTTTGADAAGRFRVPSSNGLQSIRYTGKTGTTFTGCTGGTGAVVDDAAVTQGSRGDGQAPIGADVIVATPSKLLVAVVAVLEFESGFNVDGAGGAQALGDEVEDAIRAYIDTLDVGDEVTRNKVIAAIVSVEGVHDVTTLTLNGGGGDVAVGSLEVAETSTIGLS